MACGELNQRGVKSALIAKAGEAIATGRNRSKLFLPEHATLVWRCGDRLRIAFLLCNSHSVQVYSSKAARRA
jgi:hypothetical protein